MSPLALFAALFTIGVWASLALLTDRVSHLPPLLSAGLALFIGGLTGAWQRRAWKAPPITYVVGVGGLFGYHALLFAAFVMAPAVEANLLQYLWPLLIVLLTPIFLPGKNLKVNHVIGALLGCAGTASILSSSGLALSSQHLTGYLCAIAAAFVWASYTLSCRRLPPFPTAAIAVSCLFAGILAVLLHILVKGTATLFALSGNDLLLITLLGLGPMGVSFLTWDVAIKHGDPRAVGSLAYLTPLISTVLLIVANGHALTSQTIIAAIAIMCGALLGSLQRR